MNNRLLSKFTNELIIEESIKYKNQFEMLGDFVQRCETDGKSYLKIIEENSKSGIYSMNSLGFIQLSDANQLEILPRSSDSSSICDAKRYLCTKISEKYGINYSEIAIDENYSFIEYFITIFIRECIKIIKSGLLYGYKSVEENLSMVQGSILFAENDRRNLVHKEKMYVRHDVFTPDRAENRIIKGAVLLMMKITNSPQNSLNLKKILSYLDDVKTPTDYKIEFSRCINTRNTKKYSIVLSICKMLFEKREKNIGSYITYALFFDSL